MTEERITERTDAAGNVTERVIERGNPDTVVTPVAVTPASSSGGMGGLMILMLLLALIVGGFFFFTQNTESRKDAAVAEAAEKVGDSVEKAADKLVN